MTRRTWLYTVMSVQFGLPALLLVDRLVTGEVRWYGAGWQMFSG